MNKDKRIVVRMSESLDVWCAVQAEREEMDKSSWIRAQLVKIRLGEGIPALRLPPAPQLEMASQSKEQLEEDHPRSEQPQVDLDAMLANAVAAAEEQGLTQPPQETQEQPQTSVRSLRRPPTPFAPGGRSHIEKYLGG